MKTQVVYNQQPPLAYSYVQTSQPSNHEEREEKEENTKIFCELNLKNAVEHEFQVQGFDSQWFYQKRPHTQSV